NRKLVAVMPANRVGDVIHSHKGLTYGGIVYDNLKASEVGEIVDAIVFFLKSDGFVRIDVKNIPNFYQRNHSHELHYFLIRNHGSLSATEMNLAIDYSKKSSLSKSKLKHFRRVSQLGMEIRREHQFSDFWDQVLVPRLREKYHTNPVHSKSEIELLATRFPNNICQYNVYYETKIIAGITLFNFGDVVKSQYGATTSTGENMRALDYLFINLIQEFSTSHSFFDMGTVTDSSALGYN